MTELCPCGEPLHYRNLATKYHVSRMVRDHGKTVVVRTPDGAWAVPRHYVALHGLVADRLPVIALMYGFEEVP